ncbi:MAG: lysylphosphatidylglycerol synthase transmembrane domain-containing protein [Acidobacteriota bacterium]
MKKSFIKIFLTLLITLLLLFFFFKNTDLKEVHYHLKKISSISILSFILFVFLSFVIRAFRWKYMLINQKENIKFSNLLSAIIIGFAISYSIPGRVGEVVRPVLIGYKENINKSFAFGTVVVERLFDIISAIFLYGTFLFWSLFANDSLYKDKEVFKIIKKGSIFAFSLVFSLIFLLFIFHKNKTFLRSLIFFFMKPFTPKIKQNVLNIGENFLNGINCFFYNKKNLFFIIFYSIFLWTFISFSYWFFLYFTGIKIPFFYSFPYILILIVGASVPTPGMVGGFHAASKIGLVSLFSLDENQAIGITLILHIIVVVTTIFLGILFSWKEGLSISKFKSIEKTKKLKQYIF